MAVSETLRRKLDTLPAKPGVYLMKDARGRVIYVGKAKVLRNRVRSYFQRADQKDPKTRLLVRHIVDLDYLVVNNEKEAFITENNLIKEHRPRYNVHLRDDKSYLCLKLSTGDDFPRLYLVRRFLKDGARYFGPYDSSSSLRDTLAILNRHFPLRKCTDAQFSQRTRPCLMHQIRRCPGPCVGLVSREDYAQSVNEVALFLEGRSGELVAGLTDKMERLSDDLEFEEAAQVRDQIGAIRRTLERQEAVSARMTDRDVVGMYREGGLVEVAVLFVRTGKITGSRSYPFRDLELPDAEIVGSFVKQFYAGDRYIPEEVVVPVDFEDRSEVSDYLRDLKRGSVRVMLSERGERRRFHDIALKNARAQFRSRIDRREDTSAILERIQRAFRLACPPVVIDCFDISNIGGTLTVGSKIRFRDGLPDKSGYRRFRVKTAAAGDDYGSMREVLSRWIERARKEEEFPDLVLIDGGKGQLAIAERVFRELNYLQSELASIAKPTAREASDKFYRPGRKNPIMLKRGTSALFLLQRVRDEAHRFAIEYNRRLRRKRTLRSSLEDIPGVGPGRRKALIRAFGSVKRLRGATVEEVAVVPGIPRSVADKVYLFLHPKRPDGVSRPTAPD